MIRYVHAGRGEHPHKEAKDPEATRRENVLFVESMLGERADAVYGLKFFVSDIFSSFGPVQLVWFGWAGPGRWAFSQPLRVGGWEEHCCGGSSRKDRIWGTLMGEDGLFR